MNITVAASMTRKNHNHYQRNIQQIVILIIMIVNITIITTTITEETSRKSYVQNGKNKSVYHPNNCQSIDGIQ